MTTLMIFTVMSGLGAVFMVFALLKFSGEAKHPKAKRKEPSNSILVRGSAARIVAFRSDVATKKKPAVDGGRNSDLRNKTATSSDSEKKQEAIGELARIHR